MNNLLLTKYIHKNKTKKKYHNMYLLIKYVYKQRKKKKKNKVLLLINYYLLKIYLLIFVIYSIFCILSCIY